MKQITNKEFNQSTIANTNVLIKFSADWCSPCKILTPILEELEQEEEFLSVFEINIEEEIDLVEEYLIKSIPTVLYYQEGNLIDKTVGLVTKETVRSIFKKDW